VVGWLEPAGLLDAPVDEQAATTMIVAIARLATRNGAI
jgi:hypothetical protein